MSTNETHDIGTRALRAMFWTYGAFVGGRLLSLAAIAVLARLLTPMEFGLVALALIAMAILDTFPGLGVNDALVIVHEDEVEDKAETAFAVNVVVGFVLAAALAALGPVAASFFQQPRLVGVMPVLGISFFLLGLGGTHGALAWKRMDFRSRTAAELAAATVRGAVSVILAFAGAGVWSLVIGYVAGSAASTLTLWLLVSWRPRLRPQRAHLRSLLGFGGTVTGVNVMAAFITQFDFLAVGRVLGAAQLGFYSIAARVPTLFILDPAAVAGRVLFPAFSSLQRGDVPRAFLTSLRYASLVTLPLTVFLATLSRPLTIALLGDQWSPSIEAAQVLCVWAGASAFLFVFGNVFKARGRADLLLKLAVPQAVALVIGTLAFIDRGIVAVAWVQAGIAICALLASIIIARQLFRLALYSMFQAIRPALLSAAGLATAVVVVERSISSPWPAILIGGGVGATVYMALVILMAPDSLRALKSMALPRPAGRKP